MKIQTLENFEVWKKDRKIEKLRKIIIPKIKRLQNNFIFDSQDLEHQILFKLTTFKSLKKETINETIKEQFDILIDRIRNSTINPKDLFIFGHKRKDHKWRIEWNKNKTKLIATDDHKKIAITFKEVPKDIATEIINTYHYVHCSRSNNGWIYGFYCGKSKYPIALEEIEPCSESKNYKKAILMINNINYHTCAELTRFYAIPNAPKNIISLSDGLVSRCLRDKGFEWMMTATMPCFAKTKGTTIAGGINKLLYLKKCAFEFFKRSDGKYELCVSRRKPKNEETIKSVWKLQPVAEFIRPLKKQKVGDTNLIYIEK